MNKPVVKREPVDRASEIVTFEDGSKVHRCYQPHNPHYYKKGNGELVPIENFLEPKHKFNKKLKGITKLYSKNVGSTGIRRDGSRNKFLGIRPDYTQETGEDQMEWSIVDYEINGKSCPVDLTSRGSAQQECTDLTDVVVLNHRFGVRQAVRVPAGVNVEDFKVTYRLDLTGFRVANEKVNYDNEVLRQHSSITTNNLGSITTHELTALFDEDVNNLDLSVGYISNRSLFVGTHHTGDVPTSSATTDVWTSTIDCCAGPVTDSIILFVRGQKYNNPKVKEQFVNLLVKLIGKNCYYDQKTNFIYDGRYGKPLSWIGWDETNKVLVTTVPLSYCNDISDEYSEYNTYRSGYVEGIVWETFNEEFIKEFSKPYTTSKIVLNGEYFVPHESGCFFFESHDGDVTFRIDCPKLLDNNLDIVSKNNLHSLREIEEGVYEYIKYPSLDTIRTGEIEKASYIDVDTFYGATSDGYIYSSEPTWAAARLASNATADSSATLLIAASSQTDLKGTKSFNLYRTALIFNTSAIPNAATITAADLNLCNLNGSGTGCKVRAYSYTGAIPPVAASFTSFGTSVYSSEEIEGSDVSTNSYWPPIDFNSTGRAAINKTGNTKIGMRERVYDVPNSAPPYPATGTNYFVNIYSANQSGTSRDPFLDVTYITSFSIATQDSKHGVSSDSAGAIGHSYDVSPVGSTNHSVTSDSAGSITHGYTIPALDSFHQNQVEAPALTPFYILTAGSTFHSNKSDEPILGHLYDVPVSSTFHQHTVTSPTLSFAFFIAALDSFHSIQSEEAAASFSIMVIALDSFHPVSVSSAGSIEHNYQVIPPGDFVPVTSDFARVFSEGSFIRQFKAQAPIPFSFTAVGKGPLKND
jgi:hypothetical protein